MPIYEYKCRKCGRLNSVFQKTLSSSPNARCKACGAMLGLNSLSLYAIMVERKLERTVSRASFWYLEDGSVWTTALTSSDKKQALAGALATVKDMQREREFKPNIAPHCAGCPYLYACAVREEIAQRRQAEGW